MTPKPPQRQYHKTNQKEGNIMFYWPVYDFPQDKKIWVKVRFIHETEKAVLILCEDRKIWIAKSMIYKIRLRNGDFEVYVRKACLNN
ncbi:MAG: hypothetical protein KKD05_03450 [Candidatus Omnitrophica bacterium]|nr:hypothetical protein [Candidatus Omnitrophota bacterium]